ncbi:MAG TPA: hypothetical protein VH394_19220 [Thermoanaerobaculia bacterium]|jgi:hypothetical protein|nr:hypothetical protein [Thermoanaerobaculia bacterium]
MSYGKDRPDPAGGWEGLAEWTGGLPPEEIQALAAVRPLEAFHSLLRGLAGRNPRDLLVRAAVLESLTARVSTESSPGEALSWLNEPVRGEALRALQRSGWLEPGPGFALTTLGRQAWSSIRHAAAPAAPGNAPASPLLPALPAGITPEQIVRTLLGWSVEELAAAGRHALVPVLPAHPLLNTGSVARAAEAQARETGKPPSPSPGESRRR